MVEVVVEVDVVVDSVVLVVDVVLVVGAGFFSAGTHSSRRWMSVTSSGPNWLSIVTTLAGARERARAAAGRR